MKKDNNSSTKECALVLFGSNTRILRNRFKESLQDLGDAVGLSKEAISKYENAERNPDMSTIEKISRHYGIPVDLMMKLDFSKTSTSKTFLDDDNAISNMIQFVKKENELFKTDETLKNENFKRAISLLDQPDVEPTDLDISNSIKLFNKAWEEDKLPEALANVLILHRIEFDRLNNKDVKDKEKRLTASFIFKRSSLRKWKCFGI